MGVSDHVKPYGQTKYFSFHYSEMGSLWKVLSKIVLWQDIHFRSHLSSVLRIG